jgi:hypothetical protein
MIKILLPKHLDKMREKEKRKLKRGLDELAEAIDTNDETRVNLKTLKETYENKS